MEVAGLVFGVIGVIPFVEYCKSKIEEPLKQIRENRREFETLKKRFDLVKSSYESVQTGSARMTESISFEQENNYQQKLEFVGKEIEICTDIINELEAKNPEFSRFQSTASRLLNSVRTKAKSFIYARLTKQALLDLRTKFQEIEKVLGQIRSLSALCESSVRPDYRRQVYYVLPAPKICSDFRFCAGEEPESVEAKLKGLVLGGTSRTNLSSVAKESLFCIFGKPGVGKTSALIAIGNDIDVREYFCDGIFFETFGKDATQKTLIATFAKIARLSGGISLGRRIEGLSSPPEAAMELNVWFRGTRVLYLFDDIWDPEYLPVLKMLTSSSNNMIISTRDSGIEQLSDYSVLFPFHPPRGQKARSIFGKHANITDDDVRVCELEVDNLLTTFDGHALALAIGGSLVRECVLSGNKLISALKHVLRVARNHKKSVASKEIHDYTYSSMFGAVEASLTHICNQMHPKNSWGFGMISLKLDVRTLFLRLSVLKNQVWIPISLLKRLWNFNSTEDAKKIADRFASHQLLTLKLKDNERFDTHGYDNTGYIVHDLVLEFCQSEVSPEFIRETHIELLKEYSSGIRFCGPVIHLSSFSARNVLLNLDSDDVSQEYLAWWTKELSSDGYIRQNVAYHLARASYTKGLINLVLNAKWCKLRLEGDGIFDLQDDYDTAIRFIREQKSTSAYGLNSAEVAHQLCIIAQALLGASESLKVRIGTFAFEMLGRLFNARKYLKLVDLFLTSAEDSEERPWLRPWGQIFPDPRQNRLCTPPERKACESLAFLSCGTRLAITEGSDVIIVDSETGFPLKRLQGHRGRVQCIAVDKDRVASGSDDGTILVWESVTWSQASLFRGHAGAVTCIDITTNGLYIVSGGADGTVRVWSISNRSQSGDSLVGHTDQVHSIAISEDSQFIFSASDDKTVRKWSLSGRTQLKNPFIQLEKPVRCVNLTRQGVLAVGCWESGVRTFCAETGTLRCTSSEEAHRKLRTTGLATSADGKLVLSIDWFGALRVMDIHNLSDVKSIESGACDALCISISPCDQQVAVGHFGGYVRTSNLTHMPLQKNCFPHSDSITCTKSSHDGGKVLSGSWDRTILLWDSTTGTVDGVPLVGHLSGVRAALFSSDDNYVISIDYDGVMKVWDVRTRRCVDSIELEGSSFLDQYDLRNDLNDDAVEHVLHSRGFPVFGRSGIGRCSNTSAAFKMDSTVGACVYNGQILAVLPSAIYGSKGVTYHEEKGFAAVGTLSGDLTWFSLVR